MVKFKEFILNNKENIVYWWRQTGIRQFFRNIKYGVKNLIKWFPTIWKDRDWDQVFIYTILAKKLEFQAKYIGDRDFHTESKRDAERMNLVVRLINLQQDEFYRMEYMDYEEVEHWFEPVPEHPGYKEWKHETISERYDEYFSKYPRQYKKVLNGEGIFIKQKKDGYVVDSNDKHRIALEIAHMNQERCKKLLFKIMSDHIERWWD
jgi:hypothetical protein